DRHRRLDHRHCLDPVRAQSRPGFDLPIPAREVTTVPATARPGRSSRSFGVMSAPTIIMIAGALVGASCGLIGAYLVLRRLALMGDAISHAVLLGIVVVFAVTHSRSPLLMTIGAGAVGLLTVAL